MKVPNLGSLNIDYVYPVEHFVTAGETILTGELQVNSGGKGLNQSAALARAGLEVWHAGLLGAESASLAETLNRFGVNTRLMRTVQERSGHAIIQVEPKGQNCILVYPGTNGKLTDAYVDEVLAHMEPDDVLLMQNETNLVAETIRKAHDRGIRVAWNASPVNDTMNSDLLDRIKWLFVNEVEGQALTGESDPAHMVKTLTERCPGMELVLTLGAQGSIYAHGGAVVCCPSCKVTVRDTTAAGDTFTGFFLRGVLEPVAGYTPLTLATAAAGIAVTRPGASSSIPSLQEALDFAPGRKLQETAWQA